MPEIRIALESSEDLSKLFDSELRHRRVLVRGRFELAERERCAVVIVHPRGAQFEVGAEVVYVKLDEPFAGIGLDLVELDAARLAQLERFVRGNLEDESADPAPEPSEDNHTPEATPAARNLYDRIRQLSLREREMVARQGTLPERVALERTYGGSVWEALLSNPQLSVPEVARIAKNGTLPVPLVATIVANGSWLASGEVRRALLSNPRVSAAHLDRVLQATPRAELRQIAQASPYRTQVRAAAKKRIGE